MARVSIRIEVSKEILVFQPPSLSLSLGPIQKLQVLVTRYRIRRGRQDNEGDIGEEDSELKIR